MACTAATTLGALAVVIENALAGAGSALPFGEFLGAMLPTHLAIGAIEGVITGLLLWAVGVANATVLNYNTDTGKVALHKPATTMIAFAIGALLLGFGVSRWASTAPDGLEWSVEKAEQVDQR
ncbi:MAG: PDGLE domain-containing protein [Tidjanibacter sp.]|nr:PDGLE domain-containing protein [Tidjanibacter sp.]